MAGRDFRARFAFGLELEGAEGVDDRGAVRFVARLGALFDSASFRAPAVGRRARLGIASGVDARDASDSGSESDGAGDDNGESPSSFPRGVALGALTAADFRERFGVGAGLDNGEDRFLPFLAAGVSSFDDLALLMVPRRAFGAGAFLGVASGVLSGESSRICTGRGRRE